MSSTPIASQPSPDRKMQVDVHFEMIHGNPSKDGSVAISLTRTGKRAQTVHGDGLDRRTVLVEIVWTKDSRRFVVLELDELAPYLIFAYDTQEDRQIGQELIMSDLHQALINRFGLEQLALNDKSFDPIAWVEDRALSGTIKTLPRSLWGARTEGVGSLGLTQSLTT